MSIFGSLFGPDDDQQNQNNQVSNNSKNNQSSSQTDEGTLQLRKEELDINKDKAQVGEVILSKNVVEEQQTVNVPVTHEEVVIERRSLNNQSTDSKISSDSSSNSSSSGSSCSDCGCESIDTSSSSETIRIPITEERVNVGKHTVVTEEISAHKREVEQTQKVQETIKREEAVIDKNGNPVITNEGSTQGSDSSSQGSDSSYEASQSSDDNSPNSWFQ